MWYIIKSQFEYQKGVYITITTIIVLLTLLIFTLTGPKAAEEFAHVIGLTAAVIAIAWFIHIMEFAREHTFKFLYRLPVSTFRLGVARATVLIIYLVLLILSILALFALLHYRDFSHEHVGMALSTIGMLLFFNAFFYIFDDVQFLFAKKWQRFSATFIFVIIMLFALLIVDANAFARYLPILKMQPWQEINRFMVESAKTTYGMLIALTAGVLATVLELYLFNQQKSYIE
jgi:hypothetical protein